MDKNYIILGAIILVVLLLIISIIKKAVKLVLFIVAIVIGLSLYNIFVNGRSPVEEFNDYVTNFKYGRDVASLTGKINTSAGNIKKVLEANKLDKEAVATLKKENENLHSYQEQLNNTNHTKGLNGFHSSYGGYLNTIVSISDSAAKLSSTGKLEDAKSLFNKISDTLGNLLSLKI